MPLSPNAEKSETESRGVPINFSSKDMSQRGVNCRFWSHLRCPSGTQSHYICPFRYRFNRVVHKLQKNTVMSVLVWSLLVVSLSLSHTHIGLPERFDFNFPTRFPSLSYGSPPRALILSDTLLLFCCCRHMRAISICFLIA